MKVMLVFDYNYGANPNADQGDAFWLVESPTNSALALTAWRSGTTDANSAVFNPPQDGLDPEDIIRRVEDIELHHPNWSAIEVVGFEPTPTLRAAIKAAGYKMADESACILIQR